jgi:hypothetical protein
MLISDMWHMAPEVQMRTAECCHRQCNLSILSTAFQLLIHANNLAVELLISGGTVYFQLFVVHCICLHLAHVTPESRHGKQHVA